jgi:hypothetical protein
VVDGVDDGGESLGRSVEEGGDHLGFKRFLDSDALGFLGPIHLSGFSTVSAFSRLAGFGLLWTQAARPNTPDESA